MSLKQLQRDLEGDLEPLYLIVAEAHPLRERALDAIRQRVTPHVGPAAFNHSRHRASEPDAASAFTAARTLPMMAELRLVEVAHLDQGTAAFFEALLAYVAHPSPGSVVVISGARFPKVEKGGKNWSARIDGALKKAKSGRVLKLAPKEISPRDFVMELATSRGKILDGRGAALLLASVGTDLGVLEQEVEKLVLFVGEAEGIGPDDVAVCTSMLAEAVIWDLTAGLASRDAERTLSALHRLQQAGDDSRKLLGLITWQMRDIAAAGSMMLAGASDAEVGRAVRLHPSVLRRIRPSIEAGQLVPATLFRRIATANRQMNSHRAGDRRILEGLVLEILGGQIRRPPPVPRPQFG